MRVLDLYSGLAGFSLAAHWHGWTTAAFAEKEPFCHRVLEKNFPGVPIYDNIFTFSYEQFKEDIRCQLENSGKEVTQEELNRLCSIDIVTGGFP